MNKEQAKRILDEETEQIKAKERKELIIDFDEAVREERSEAIIVKFQGEKFELPPNAPAWLPLFINRSMNDEGVVDDKRNLELIERLLGQEFADRIMDSSNFISFELINKKILEPVMNHWGMGFNDESAKNETTHS